MPKLTGVRERRRRTTQKVGAFAPLVGYSRSALIAIEAGSRPASPEGAQRIADVLTELGVPTSYEDLVPTPPPQQPKGGPKAPRGRKDPKKSRPKTDDSDADSLRVAS